MKKLIGSITFSAHIKSARESKAHKVRCRNIEDEEKAEIKAYLRKLKSLVPFMPKNKKISKPEVISYVIEYIHDLSETLGLPPCSTEFDTKSKGTKSYIQNIQSSTVTSNISSSPTQPALIISSSIVQPNSSNCHKQQFVPSIIPANQIKKQIMQS